GGDLEQRERRLEVGAGGGLVAAVGLELGEGEDGGGLLGLFGDGGLVGLDGVVVAAVLLVDAGQGDAHRPALAAALRGALLEVFDELFEVAVALAVELGEALDGEGLAGLAEDDRGVAGDERVGARAGLAFFALGFLAARL